MTGTTVAVLGTGIMGLPMAVNLHQAGLKVRAWNRTREKAHPLASHGVEVAETPEQAVAGADFVLTMLADGSAVDSVREAVLGSSAVWIQSSTVGVAWTEKFAGAAAKAGVPFVDAPVLGTKQPAEQGKLVVLASGPDELRERCAPVFDAIGARTLWAGSAPGIATKLKLVANAWVLALNNATAESIGLAEALGLDPRLFLDAISGGPVDVGYAHVKGDAMISRSFPVSFSARHAAKDARLVLEAAGNQADLAGTRAALAHLEAAIEAGHADDDMAAVYFGVRQDR